MKKLLIAALGAWLLPASAFAQMPAPPPRTITVSGEGKEEAAPDQAVLSMTLASRDKDLAKAKKSNDALVARLVKITGQFNIPAEKIATSSVYIAPEYNYNNGQQQFMDYTVSRSFRVTMDKLDMQEKLLSAIIDAKMDQVGGVEFRLANPESHAAVLRVRAFEDAKAKALALAQAAGGKLGPALTISTTGELPMPPRPMPMMAGLSRVGAEASVAPSLPGMVELHESVTVTFALE